MTFSLSQVEDPIQKEVPLQPVPHTSSAVPLQPVPHTSPAVPLQPVPHTSPAVTVEQSVTPKPKTHLVKKKLVQDAKQEALKLAEERHQRNMETDERLYQERLELLRHEKQLLTSYYAKKEFLIDLKIKHEIARHEKEMSSL